MFITNNSQLPQAPRGKLTYRLRQNALLETRHINLSLPQVERPRFRYDRTEKKNSGEDAR